MGLGEDCHRLEGRPEAALYGQQLPVELVFRNRWQGGAGASWVAAEDKEIGPEGGVSAPILLGRKFPSDRC